MKLLNLVLLVLLFGASVCISALFAADGYHDYNSFVIGATAVGIIMFSWYSFITIVNLVISGISVSCTRYKRVPVEAIVFGLLMLFIGLVL